jgi:pimeloyl-ACP methyl ester carboxylesterase
MPSATINGLTIAYDDVGQGIPVLFVHGYPLNRQMWEPQVAALSSQARIITIDLRGHGESAAPLWFSTMDLFADDLNALLDHLSLNRAVVCGFSMGGYATFAFVRKYPERVQALILADTRPQPDTAEAKQNRFNAAQTAHQQGAKAIADGILPRLLTPASIEGNSTLVAKVRAIVEATPVTGIASDLMALAERPDSQPTLAQINVPTLIIVGADDSLTPPADSQLMAERIANARLVTIPNAAHLSNMEEPEAFNRAVGEFLSTLSA